MTADQIAALCTEPGKARQIQLVQTEFRQQVCDAWDLKKGSRVLEIGCGQGDMTAVLADRVGPDGHVTAVDLADPSYGAPLTLQQATDRLKQTVLGERINFRFQFDLLDNDFEDDSFEVVLLAHCSWYFADRAQLTDTLREAARLAPRLAFSEWDLSITHLEQASHLLAALIQGGVEAFRPDGAGNIRSPFSLHEFREIIAAAGWKETSLTGLDTTRLQDARWEIDMALSEARPLPNMPKKLIDFLAVQRGVLERLSRQVSPAPLPSYAMLAERNR
jgi:SAM-dependent methyltransferase